MSHDHHHHPHEENPWAGQGAVVLDIGEDIGALVVSMPPSTIGREVDISAEHEPADRPRRHVAVVERPVAGGTMPSLVFPDLIEGRYRLMPKGSEDVRLVVEVRGGEVTRAAWPD